MTVVKIIEGHFKGFRGVIEGYHYKRAIIAVPFENGRNEVVLLESKDYEVIEA